MAGSVLLEVIGTLEYLTSFGSRLCCTKTNHCWKSCEASAHITTMATPLTKDGLKKSVYTAFANEIPNGWVLGWEECRFRDRINQCTHPFTAENWTSFDYAFCNSYEVIFRTNNRISCSLTILISFISDVYCMHWTAYSADGRSGWVVPTPDTSQAKNIERNLRSMLAEVGIQELPDEWFDEPIPGITLELSGDENVTLGKCLFQDYDG